MLIRIATSHGFGLDPVMCTPESVDINASDNLFQETFSSIAVVYVSLPGRVSAAPFLMWLKLSELSVNSIQVHSIKPQRNNGMKLAELLMNNLQVILNHRGTIGNLLWGMPRAWTQPVDWHGGYVIIMLFCIWRIGSKISTFSNNIELSLKKVWGWGVCIGLSCSYIQVKPSSTSTHATSTQRPSTEKTESTCVLSVGLCSRPRHTWTNTWHMYTPLRRELCASENQLFHCCEKITWFLNVGWEYRGKCGCKVDSVSIQNPWPVHQLLIFKRASENYEWLHFVTQYKIYIYSIKTHNCKNSAG